MTAPQKGSQTIMIAPWWLAAVEVIRSTPVKLADGTLAEQKTQIN